MLNFKPFERPTINKLFDLYQEYEKNNKINDQVQIKINWVANFDYYILKIFNKI